MNRIFSRLGGRWLLRQMMPPTPTTNTPPMTTPISIAEGE
jgi:hypothetical protein